MEAIPPVHIVHRHATNAILVCVISVSHRHNLSMRRITELPNFQEHAKNVSIVTPIDCYLPGKNCLISVLLPNSRNIRQVRDFTKGDSAISQR